MDKWKHTIHEETSKRVMQEIKLWNETTNIDGLIAQLHRSLTLVEAAHVGQAMINDIVNNSSLKNNPAKEFFKLLFNEQIHSIELACKLHHFWEIILRHYSHMYNHPASGLVNLYHTVNLYKTLKTRVIDIDTQMFRDIVPRVRVSVDPELRKWNNGVVCDIAQACYDGDGNYYILADALEEAGCVDNRILDHLRNSEPHYKGCWATMIFVKKHNIPLVRETSNRGELIRARILDQAMEDPYGTWIP